MKTFHVPGVSLAVVKDGKVVLAKGYGVKALGNPAPVDARTRFGIASNTKAFTATALALLVEEGKLEWDAPVIRYLPGFAMYDPFVTRELTTLCANVPGASALPHLVNAKRAGVRRPEGLTGATVQRRAGQD